MSDAGSPEHPASGAPNPPTQDEEPAEGSRETVEEAERQQDEE